MANGTAALHLALLAVGCGPGDEAIVPALTFVAAANAIRVTGATPVFCDIVSEHDLNLDPASVEAALTNSTKAILVLHYGGHPCAMDEVLELADRRGLTVVEDAAHAPGATWRRRSCGTLGAVGCFSFFSNKNMPVGEGGMIVTDDDELARKMRLLRSHGMTTLTWERHRGHASSYDVVETGFNFRLDDIRATIGLVQLSRLAAENTRRARIVQRYRELLAGSRVVVPFSAELPPGSVSSDHLMVVVLPEDGPRRDDVRAALAEKRIQTSVHYPPIHSFTQYAGTSRRPLPVTDALAGRILTLPLYGHMTDTQVELVAGELTALTG